jgi:hypothetical protein
MKEAAMTKISAIFSLMLAAVICLSAEEIEVAGEVVTVDEVAYENGNIYVLQAQIRTRNQEMVLAELGPAWFLQSDVAPGDEVTVRGKYLEANRIRVRAMIRNSINTAVRDEDYEPLWLRTRLRAENYLYNPHTEKTVDGKITDLYVEETSATMEAMVKAQNGELVRVRLAPEWYLRSMVRMGDDLSVRGSAVKDDGGILIMAREMRNRRMNYEIAMRDARGFPDWRRRREEHEGRRNEYRGRGKR